MTRPTNGTEAHPRRERESAPASRRGRDEVRDWRSQLEAARANLGMSSGRPCSEGVPNVASRVPPSTGLDSSAPHLVGAVEAARRLIDAALTGLNVPRELFDEMAEAAKTATSSDEIQRRSVGLARRQVVWRLAAAEALVAQAAAMSEAKYLDSAARQITAAYALAAGDEWFTNRQRSAAVQVTNLLRGAFPLSRALKQSVSGALPLEPRSLDRLLMDVFGLSASEVASLEMAIRATRAAEYVAQRRPRQEDIAAAGGDPADDVGPTDHRTIEESWDASDASAEGLAANRRDQQDENPPSTAYDMTDASVKVRALRASSFRGAPTGFDLDLMGAKGAESLLLFGDNGVGKSTIVDALEFALQGRVGRSSSLGSSLAPSVRSWSSTGATSVWVSLTDGSATTRHLVRSRFSGEPVAWPQTVRPGFRLAPILLKRSDILRFLDTNALERGTTLFDFFPAGDRGMGQFPDEELRRAAEEAFRLRIERRSGAEQLGRHFGVVPDALTDRSAVRRLVRERFAASGASWEEFVADGGLTRIPPELSQLITRHLEVCGRYSEVNKLTSRGVQILNPKAYETQARSLQNRIERLGPEVTAAFKRISRTDHVAAIEVFYGRSGPVSLDVVVRLESGQHCFAQQIFSEGNRDLLALLLFAGLALQASELGQAKVLILDDVLQSVDANIRRGFMEYVAERFRDWQLILTIHDRLWFEQVRGILRRNSIAYKELHITRWSFGNGPVVGAGPASRGAGILSAIATDDPERICEVSGKQLEVLASNLSWRLGVSVVRKRDDKYTLGDLWPGVAKSLRKRGLAEVVAKVDSLKDLRNLLGAHHNEWAAAFPLDEARFFGEAVHELTTLTYCDQCMDWVSAIGDTAARCSCGTTQIRAGG